VRRSKPDVADPAECERTALDLLARREHSRRELERKLGARGFQDETIAATLDALEQSGELAAARFTESFIRARAAKGQGPARIRAELAERGIDREQAAELLRVAGIDWAEVASSVRAKRFGADRLQGARAPSAVPRVSGLRPRSHRPRARVRRRRRLRLRVPSRRSRERESARAYGIPDKTSAQRERIVRARPLAAITPVERRRMELAQHGTDTRVARSPLDAAVARIEEWGRRDADALAGSRRKSSKF
jgi:regulatory protein